MTDVKTETKASKIQIPLKVVKAKRVNPRYMLLYGKPKIGKTTMMSGLEDCLILQADPNGADYIDALSIDVKSIDDLIEIKNQIKENKYPYQYVCIDTLSGLENIALKRGEQIYSETTIGKNWFVKGKPKYKSIINLPDGAGYRWLYQGYLEVIDIVKRMAPVVILMGHVKDIQLKEKDSETINVLDIDVVGNLKKILAKNCDTIGYVRRDPKSPKNIISFKAGKDALQGTRSPHLKEQEIVINELVKDEESGEETMVFHWDKIFKEQ